ncbi:uncharacterized protein LOC143020128 [Oratosquilla oratoria]|uniref:uncharacterized protein LOC143020128 n=1 Tax=Oratosquilla oratoria TaxID=337810 RepID=UPI003F75A948
MASPPASVLHGAASLLLLVLLLLLPEAPACQFYCYSFLRGAFCCQASEADPYANQAVGRRAGLCPSARRGLEEASVPYECSQDDKCPYHRDKCCYDAILKHKVCKSPLYSGSNDYLLTQQQRRRQITGAVTSTEYHNPPSRPTVETTTTTKRPTKSSTATFATWYKNKRVYASMFPHSKPQPQRGLYPFHPSYNPNTYNPLWV